MSNQLVDFELHRDNFVWDMKMHFPIPTVDYFLQRSGIDILMRFDTTTEAQGFLVGVTRSAKNYAFREKLLQDRMAWEYAIAHDEKLIYEVLEYIIEFVKVALVSGDYQKLFETHNTKNRIYIPALENAYNNLTMTSKRIQPTLGGYYNGY